MSVTNYRKYLALTAVQQRAESVGGELSQTVSFRDASYWRKRVIAAPDEPEYPMNVKRFAEVQARLLAENSDDKHEIAAKLLAKYPDMEDFEAGGLRSLYFEPLDGVGVCLDIAIVN